MAFRSIYRLSMACSLILVFSSAAFSLTTELNNYDGLKDIKDQWGAFPTYNTDFRDWVARELTNVSKFSGEVTTIRMAVANWVDGAVVTISYGGSFADVGGDDLSQLNWLGSFKAKVIEKLTPGVLDMEGNEVSELVLDVRSAGLQLAAGESLTLGFNITNADFAAILNSSMNNPSGQSGFYMTTSGCWVTDYNAAINATLYHEAGAAVPAPAALLPYGLSLAFALRKRFKRTKN